MKVAQDITELVGNTPLVLLSKLSPPGVRVLGKIESMNPCFSVKDRIALAMIERAEAEGKIDADTVIIEPTSGNTGIGLAFVCAQRGYRLVLTMPESMSQERRKLLRRLGAELVLTPPELGMRGAVERAEELVAESARAFLPQQFTNSANPEVHYNTTGPEIWRDTDGEVDIFVAAVGTGGSVSGVGRYLKEQRKDIRVVALEPADSAVISGNPAGPHKIQGIGAGFVPATYDRSVVDEVILVSNDSAFETSARLAREEGILAGISAGANVWAALELAKRPENQGKTLVTVICDTGERYLSVWPDSSDQEQRQPNPK